MPLKEISLRVTFPKVYRYGIKTIQLLATLTIVYHLLRCGIVVYLVNLRHLLHSIPLDVCFVSQLERCCYVSFRGLILSCSTFEKNNSLGSFLSSRCHVSWSSQSKIRDNDGDRINVHLKCHLDREGYLSLCSPFILPYA